MVSCHHMIDAGACNLREMARDLGAYLHLRDLNEGRSFMRVTAINRIKITMQGRGQENTNQCRSVGAKCWVLIGVAPTSTALHCILLRHAALEVFLAFAGHSAVEGARFLRGGDACMQSVCDLADRGVHSPVSLERHAEVMNRKY